MSVYQYLEKIDQGQRAFIFEVLVHKCKLKLTLILLGAASLSIANETFSNWIAPK